jgi:hypothetical protein
MKNNSLIKIILVKIKQSGQLKIKLIIIIIKIIIKIIIIIMYI